MRPDLRQLTIKKGELRRLSGVSLDALICPPTRGRFLTELARTGLAVALLSISGAILAIGFPLHARVLIAIHGAIAGLLILQDCRRWWLSRRSRTLIDLMGEVERFNAAIKAIDINDQLEQAGNSAVKLPQRDRVIAALRLAREDLVRALKTERILRENAGFIQLNAELFASNLETLTAMQVSDRANEYSRLLDEAMQISLGVQAEMRKLQGQRST